MFLDAYFVDVALNYCPDLKGTKIPSSESVRAIDGGIALTSLSASRLRQYFSILPYSADRRMAPTKWVASQRRLSDCYPPILPRRDWALKTGRFYFHFSNY